MTSMVEPATPETPAPESTRGRPPEPRGRLRGRGLVAVLVAVTLVGIGATAALWLSRGVRAGATIANGDLALTPGITFFTWQETTPTKTSDLQSDATAAAATSLAGFLGVKGDEVELRYHVTATLAGANLQAKVNVAWNGAAPTLAGMAVTGYRVYNADASSQLLALTPLGTPGQPSGLGPVDDPSQADRSIALVVAAVVRWTATPSYAGDFTTTSTATVSSLPFVISLDQVRG